LKALQVCFLAVQKKHRYPQNDLLRQIKYLPAPKSEIQPQNSILNNGPTKLGEPPLGNTFAWAIF